jgi:hypothetical protein
MKRTIILASSLALFLALAPGSSAGQSNDRPTAAAAPDTIIYDAASAMAFFKTLGGDWQVGTSAHEHGSGSPSASSYGSSLSFKVKAAGSAVVQTTRAGQPGEMESIFHMDGDQLLLTHYCALQNAPVLKFQPSSKPGEIKFVFQGGTNFDPTVDAHFHEGTFQVKDKDTVEQTFTVYANGKPTPDGRSIIRRKASQ